VRSPRHIGVLLQLAGACGLMSACGSDETAPRHYDLSAAISPDEAAGRFTPSRDDLSVGDMSLRIFDLAWTACVGTRLEGTCVVQFFAPFIACFQPAGHCFSAGHNYGDIDCWQNGAGYITGLYQGGVALYATSSFGPNTCLRHFIYDPLVPVTVPTDQFCLTPDCGYTFGGDGGSDVSLHGGATYDSRTGIFTCPDGTRVDVGPSLGGCAVLNELLDPSSLCDHQATPSCR
jgi:hypothetical protein